MQGEDRDTRRPLTSSVTAPGGFPGDDDVVGGRVRAASFAAPAPERLLKRRAGRLVHFQRQFAARGNDLDFGGFRWRRLVGLFVAEVGTRAGWRQRKGRALGGFRRQIGRNVGAAGFVEAGASFAPPRRGTLVSGVALVEGGSASSLRRPRGRLRSQQGRVGVGQAVRAPLPGTGRGILLSQPR
jgi:hypothetical protein